VKRTTLAIAVVAAALVVSACGGDEGTAGSLVEGSDVSVRMFDNRYEYTEIRIPVGGSITWVGAGRNAHNSVDAAGSWSTEGVFGSLEQYQDQEAVLTFDEAGEYTFFCTFHGNAEGAGMAGKLIVGGIDGG
jgi:plastocyanin